MLTIHRIASRLAGFVLCLLAACRVDGHYYLPDAPVDASVPMTGPWVVTEQLLNVNDPQTSETSPSTTADHLELYFLRSDQAGGDIFVASRSLPMGAWESVAPAWTTPDRELAPKVSPDGLELYFMKDNNVWRAVRPSRTATWGAPTEMFVGSRVALTGDGLTMYYSSMVSDPKYQIRKRIRAALDAAWGPEEPVGGLDQTIRYYSISVDGHDLYIVVSDPVDSGLPRVAEMSRASTSEPYRGLQELPTLTTPPPAHQRCDLHASGEVMYCDRVTLSSQSDIFMVTRQR